MRYVSRAGWGARQPRTIVKADWSQRSGVTIHYSAGPADQSIRVIQDYHMDTKKWSDIGYNWLVRRGVIYQGRGWDRVGAHATGYNTSTIGVCFVGRSGDAGPADLVALKTVYDEACRLKGRALAVYGHRDLGSTDCPGDQLYGWIRKGMLTGGDMSTPEEVWHWDGCEPPEYYNNPDNPTWTPRGYLRHLAHAIRQCRDAILGKQDGIIQRVDALAEMVQGLPTVTMDEAAIAALADAVVERLGDINASAVASAVVDELANRLNPTP